MLGREVRICFEIFLVKHRNMPLLVESSGIFLFICFHNLIGLCRTARPNGNHMVIDSVPELTQNAEKLFNDMEQYNPGQYGHDVIIHSLSHNNRFILP